jgi:hypothetical protein
VLAPLAAMYSQVSVGTISCHVFTSVNSVTCNFLLINNILHTAPEEIFSWLFCLVILEVILGICLFQTICLENVSLRNEGEYIQNMEMLLPDGTMHHKAAVALIVFLRVQVWKDCYGCFLRERRSNEAIFHHATPLINVWCSPLLFNNFLRLLTLSPNSAEFPHTHSF